MDSCKKTPAPRAGTPRDTAPFRQSRPTRRHVPCGAIAISPDARAPRPRPPVWRARRGPRAPQRSRPHRSPCRGPSTQKALIARRPGKTVRWTAPRGLLTKLAPPILLLSLSCGTVRAWAQDRPSESAPPGSMCLEDDDLRKGVQARNFLKAHRIEIIPEGGLNASDLLSSSYAWGGSIAFYLTEDLGIEATFTY